MWNPHIGGLGAWDTMKMRTVSVDRDSAVCLTNQFGTYAIIAELKEEPYVQDDLTWLIITKYVGYGLSVILLTILVLIILFSS